MPSTATNDRPTAWRVPLARNPNFTGRDNVLAGLRRELSNTDPMWRVQVVAGPGGMGKTQTLCEYAYRFRDEYKIIWWITADDSAGAEVGLADLARALGLTSSHDAGTDDVRGMLFRHLSTRSDWLLLFDDVEGPDALAGLIPVERSGHVLISSRNQNWQTVGRTFPLGVFERAESVKFLLRRTRRAEDATTVDKLAAALGDMPLALDQAAALIGQTHLAFADYLERFETHWGDLLRSGKPSSDYPLSVAMTWELSFRQVEDQFPRAADLLAMCVFFSPEGIPRRLIRAAASHATPALAPVLADAISCGELIGQLTGFSLVDATDRVVRMHPLASALGRDRLGEQERAAWASVAVRAVASLFSFDASVLRTWPESAELLSHALAAASHADRLGVAPESVRSVYNHAGDYLLALARYDRAKRLLERAAEIALELWGADSPRHSPIANNLGRVLLRTGDLAAARVQFERALVLDEKVYGPAHPHVAELVNNRGVCLHGLGEVDRASADFQRALEIYELNFGPDHAKTASILNNLGFLLLCRGEYGPARARLNEALRMSQTTLGTSHPTVAAVLRNLGACCRATRDTQDARLCYEKALDIDVAVFGQDHPDTASDLAGLGETFEDLGESHLARDLLERSVAIEETHPATAAVRLVPRLRALARTLLSLGEVPEAQACALRADRLAEPRTTDTPALFSTSGRIHSN